MNLGSFVAAKDSIISMVLIGPQVHVGPWACAHKAHWVIRPWTQLYLCPPSCPRLFVPSWSAFSRVATPLSAPDSPHVSCVGMFLILVSCFSFNLNFAFLCICLSCLSCFLTCFFCILAPLVFVLISALLIKACFLSPYFLPPVCVCIWVPTVLKP